MGSAPFLAAPTPSHQPTSHCPRHTALISHRHTVPHPPLCVAPASSFALYRRQLVAQSTRALRRSAGRLSGLPWRLVPLCKRLHPGHLTALSQLAHTRISLAVHGDQHHRCPLLIL